MSSRGERRRPKARRGRVRSAPMQTLASRNDAGTRCRTAVLTTRPAPKTIKRVAMDKTTDDASRRARRRAVPDGRRHGNRGHVQVRVRAAAIRDGPAARQSRGRAAPARHLSPLSRGRREERHFDAALRARLPGVPRWGWPTPLLGRRSRSIALLRNAAKAHGGNGSRILIGGLVGPRGDAYELNRTITADEAKPYHATQL